ncbi:uncharacterized protein LOC106161024 isoform X2 [Lingula anatina]|nr:uncharacterized protein LOC106161024 isoform X2 [Lingula anatina]|eukprot:XP_023932240.1 uncharacterized protein LOC106161024 isoform X2 [Lingula anatina]
MDTDEEKLIIGIGAALLVLTVIGIVLLISCVCAKRFQGKINLALIPGYSRRSARLVKEIKLYHRESRRAPSRRPNNPIDVAGQVGQDETDVTTSNYGPMSLENQNGSSFSAVDFANTNMVFQTNSRGSIALVDFTNPIYNAFESPDVDNPSSVVDAQDGVDFDPLYDYPQNSFMPVEDLPLPPYPASDKPPSDYDNDPLYSLAGDFISLQEESLECDVTPDYDVSTSPENGDRCVLYDYPAACLVRESESESDDQSESDTPDYTSSPVILGEIGENYI